MKTFQLISKIFFVLMISLKVYALMTPDEIKARLAAESTAPNGNTADDDQASSDPRRAAAAAVNGRGGAPTTGSPTGSGPQPTIGCPFYRDTSTVQALVSSTRGHLQTLVSRANQDRQNCSAVAGNLNATNTAFEALTSNAAQNAFPTNPGEVACVNYESTLRQQYNLAVAEYNNSVPSFSRNPYSDRCQNDSNFLTCVQNRYTSEIATWDTTCRNNGLQNLNASTRQNIEHMVDGIEGLISNADTCGSIGRESIIQSALQQATSTASLAAGMGLPSLGISIVGRLLSSVANSIFNRNDPERVLRTLDDNLQRPGVQCLFYDLQRTALRCESIPNAAAPTLAEPNACEQNISNLSEISDFARTLNARFTDPAATTSPDATAVARRQDYSRMFDEISRTLNPNLELLQGVATAMNNPSSTPTNRSAGAKLNRLLTQYRELNDSGSTPTDEQFQNFVEKFSNTGDDAVNLPDILARYLDSQSAADQNFAQALANSSVRRAINNTSEAARNVESDLSRVEQSTLHLSDALTAMVRVSRNTFANRLETLKNNWDRTGSNTNDAGEKMAMLNELFTLCMTTQGMSYFNGSSNVHNFREVRPNSKYQNACQMFECRDAQSSPTLFVPFNPNDTRYGNSSVPVADKFRLYQCAQNRSLNEKLTQLRQNINTSGQICGQ